jgi:hypothetical protein
LIETRRLASIAAAVFPILELSAFERDASHGVTSGRATVSPFRSMVAPVNTGNGADGMIVFMSDTNTGFVSVVVMGFTASVIMTGGAGFTAAVTIMGAAVDFTEDVVVMGADAVFIVMLRLVSTASQM